MTRVCAAMGFAALALLHQAASAARAETPNEPSLNVVRLAGAESCDRGSALARAVEQRLGHRAFGPQESAAGSVEVSLQRDGANFRAEVRSYDAAGELAGARSVRPDARTCAALTEAVAVVLSVMLDPEAALGPVAPKTPEIPATAAVVEQPRYPQLPALPPAPLPPVRRMLGVFVRAGLGVLPAPALIVGAAYEQSVRFGGVRIEASASLVHEERRAVRTEGTRMAIASAAALYCPVYRTRSIVRISTCLGGEAGAWFISTVGVADGTHKTAPFLAGSARFGVAVALGARVALQVGVAADALILRPEYRFDVADGSRESVYRAPALTGLGDVGLAARF